MVLIFPLRWFRMIDRPQTQCTLERPESHEAMSDPIRNKLNLAPLDSKSELAIEHRNTKTDKEAAISDTSL
jgi:hypothetical protein